MRVALVQSLILNSSELPNSLLSTSDQPPWSDVRRIYRRICLLRATGKDNEALALEQNEFSEVLATARKAPEAAQIESRIFSEESERVASATVLAELLAPILANKLQAAPAGVSIETPATVTARKPETALASPPRRARVSSQETSESAGAGVPGIADLIDGMLSQERDYAPPQRSA